MQNAQRAILGTLDGAEEFLDQNAEALGGVAANGTRKKLGTIVSALTSHHTTQTQSVVSAQQLTLSTSAARRALLQDHLASIAAVAKAERPTVPELERPYRRRALGSIRRTAGIVVAVLDGARLSDDRGRIRFLFL